MAVGDDDLVGADRVDARCSQVFRQESHHLPHFLASAQADKEQAFARVTLASGPV